MHKSEQGPEQSPWILETLGVVLLLINMLFSGMLPPEHVESASEVFGRVLAPLILGLLVVGVFNLAPGMRNRRSRAKVFLGTMCFILLGSCGRFLGNAQRSVGQAVPTTPGSAVFVMAETNGLARVSISSGATAIRQSDRQRPMTGSGGRVPI